MASQFLLLFQVVAPIFVVMALGYGARKIRILTTEADKSLGRLAVNLLAPALAFDTIIGNKALIDPANIILPPIFGFGSIVLGILAGRAFLPLLRSPKEAVRRTFVYTNSIQNYGFLAIPLCAAVFDRATMGVLFAFILGVELAFWTIALWQLTGHAGSRPWWKSINPPMVAIPLAMLLNACGAETWLPPSLRTTFHMLGVCAVPLSLLLSGALIADFITLRAMTSSPKTIGLSLILRLGVLPFIMIAGAKFLPLDTALKNVLIVEAAMPAAIFPIILTKVHDGDVPTALQVVLGTSLVGFFTIPLWVSVGLHWALGLP